MNEINQEPGEDSSSTDQAAVAMSILASTNTRMSQSIDAADLAETAGMIAELSTATAASKDIGNITVASLDLATELRCDSMNVSFGGQATGRIGPRIIAVGDAKDFIDAYAGLVPASGDEATAIFNRSGGGFVKLRMANFDSREISVHLLYLDS